MASEQKNNQTEKNSGIVKDTLDVLKAAIDELPGAKLAQTLGDKVLSNLGVEESSVLRSPLKAINDLVSESDKEALKGSSVEEVGEEKASPTAVNSEAKENSNEKGQGR